MSPYQLLLSSLVVLGCSSVTAIAQPQLGVVCTNGSKVTVRPYCLVGEEEATISTFAKKGPAGNAGPAGSDGAKGRTVSSSNHGGNSVGQQGLTLTQTCPEGKIVVGGGCFASNPTVSIARSYPSESAANRWVCQFKPQDGSGFPQADLSTFAVCIDS